MGAAGTITPPVAAASAVDLKDCDGKLNVRVSCSDSGFHGVGVDAHALAEEAVT